MERCSILSNFFLLFISLPSLLHTVRHHEPRPIVLTIVTHQGFARGAADDAAGIEHIGAGAAATAYLLAVAGEVKSLEALAIGTATVISDGAVEVSTADDESDVVATSKLVNAAVLILVADNIILAGCLAIVADDVDMAQGGAPIARGGDSNIAARTLDSSKSKAGGMRLLLQHEVAGITAAIGIVALTAATEDYSSQSQQQREPIPHAGVVLRQC